MTVLYPFQQLQDAGADGGYIDSRIGTWSLLDIMDTSSSTAGQWCAGSVYATDAATDYYTFVVESSYGTPRANRPIYFNLSYKKR